MFSYEFCEISRNTFFHRTLLVAASVSRQSRPHLHLKSEAYSEYSRTSKMELLGKLLHGFTISVLVLILPVFRYLLLRNGNVSSEYLFWNERPQRADSKWQQESYFTSTLINFSIIFSNWYYISTELLSVTKPSITYQSKVFCKYISYSNKALMNFHHDALNNHVPAINLLEFLVHALSITSYHSTPVKAILYLDLA